jgi:hypothetical protein
MAQAKVQPFPVLALPSNSTTRCLRHLRRGKVVFTHAILGCTMKNAFSK